MSDEKGMPGWKALGFENYKEYLDSILWKEKSEWIKEVAGNKCQKCGNKFNLQVHHIDYTNVGNEGMDDVIVLCKECHKKEHGYN